MVEHISAGFGISVFLVLSTSCIQFIFESGTSLVFGFNSDDEMLILKTYQNLQYLL